MCPMCVTTATIAAISSASTGGILVVVATKLHLKSQVRSAPPSVDARTQSPQKQDEVSHEK
jgi:hypothetical protein